MRKLTTIQYLFLSLAGVWLTVALLGLSIDPYLFEPQAGLLPIPRRWPVIVNAVGLIIAALISAGITWLPRWGLIRLSVVFCGGTLAVSLLFCSAPFVKPETHCVMSLLVAYSTMGWAICIYHFMRRRKKAFIPTKIVISVLMLGIVALLLESVFALLPMSHHVGYTLAARHWFKRYWKPKNREGYRDAERRSQAGAPIYVLGDSFVAGVGIKDIEDRVSNILHQRLCNKFRVHNLGMNGSDTRDEYRRLLQQTETPRLLILFYYLNDITSVAQDCGYKIPYFTPYGDLPSPIAALVTRSYLIDFVYWRFPRYDLSNYENCLVSYYQDRRVMDMHLKDLQKFVDYSSERRTSLLVVCFPDLAQVDETRNLLNPVMEFFSKNNVPVVEVATLLQSLPVRRRIVNVNDRHPSVEVNHLVAQAVLNKIDQHGLLKRNVVNQPFVQRSGKD